MIKDKELELFASIIDECRSLVEKVNIKVEISIEYIFCQLYGKTLLTMCEIFTLLNAGYPEGAMTLARNTYETMIIMAYLNKRRADKELIERFYDDYRVRTCYDHIKYLEWIKANGHDNDDTNERLQERNDECKSLTEKYYDFTLGKNGSNYFRQYWWAGKDKSFNQLRIESNFPYNYLYDISCYRVHAGMTGMLRFDSEEDGLLIGACDNGKEMPLTYSLLNFRVTTELFFDIHSIECSDVLLKMTNLLKGIQ